MFSEKRNVTNPFSTNLPLLYPLKTWGIEVGIEMEHWLKMG